MIRSPNFDHKNDKHCAVKWQRTAMLARLAARLYAERFSNRHLPDYRVFSRLYQRLRDTGSFEVNIREAGGRRRLVNPKDEERILQHFNRNPNKYASHGE